MTRRTERINDLIREELSDLLRRSVKDPRLQSFVTVTEVEVTPDLRHAKVFISVLGTEEEKHDVFKALESAGGFLRHELGERVHLRRAPELDFRRDDTMEKADRIMRLLKEVNATGDQGTTDEEPGEGTPKA